jgi:hypothetical protein
MLGRLSNATTAAAAAAGRPRLPPRRRVRPLWTSTPATAGSGSSSGSMYRFERPLPSSMLAAPPPRPPSMAAPSTTTASTSPASYYRAELSHKAVAPFFLGSL